ncbi:ferritin heavy polypeptide-like 17 [Nannospalax galili]|uniref:ferritin heavy polypeptide-like 17 n=1 Tax=Nannospalax galili TaxID=1026970 RepID=UPI0004ED17E0|nr:ferritin heavy polypeptide-like 17 [Nannospalax galili]
MAEAHPQLRQNCHPDCKDAVNMHIKLQLYASDAYLSTALDCNCDDMALGNLKRFFLRKSHKQRASTEMFLFLQNQWGGQSVFHQILRPDRDNWSGGLRVMESAFNLDMTINLSLLNLQQLATE